MKILIFGILILIALFSLYVSFYVPFFFHSLEAQSSKPTFVQWQTSKVNLGTKDVGLQYFSYRLNVPNRSKVKCSFPNFGLTVCQKLSQTEYRIAAEDLNHIRQPFSTKKHLFTFSVEFHSPHVLPNEVILTPIEVLDDEGFPIDVSSLTTGAR